LFRETQLTTNVEGRIWKLRMTMELTMKYFFIVQEISHI